MNRYFFDLNERLDRHAALPAATFYTDTCAASRRGRSIHNFLDNLGGPVNVANDLLQTQFTNAGKAAARFVINTTIGVAGIFDVATGWGLPARNRDFGETLGTYGVPQGPYLVLPVAGPTAVRDLSGEYIDGFFSPLYYWHVDIPAINMSAWSNPPSARWTAAPATSSPIAISSAPRWISTPPCGTSTTSAASA